MSQYQQRLNHLTTKEQIPQTAPLYPHGKNYHRAVEMNNVANRIDHVKTLLALVLNDLKGLPPAVCSDLLHAEAHLHRAGLTAHAASSLYSTQPNSQ